jgi:hypothetical protein
MTEFSHANTLHRLVKEAIDSGAAASVAEAEAMFRGFRLRYSIDRAKADDLSHQIALLTGVALARRVFLGGVSVSGPLSAPLKVPFRLGATLGEAVVNLGGSIGDGAPKDPAISIGGAPSPRSEGFRVRTAFAGWRGGIVPAHTDLAPVAAPTMPLAPMLSAALAVNEAFFYTRSGNKVFGCRPVGLSLWRPSQDIDWLNAAADEPDLRYLPARLWLIGLGHLGQAYLWGLGLLPYPNPTGLALVLQDVDTITPSTESTSILTDSAQVGQKKTRTTAAWAENRGFTVSIHERLFTADFRRQPDEPSVALCGLDNALGRRALDQVGFDFVVEAGLGRGYSDFQTIRLHTLPASRTGASIWASESNNEDVRKRPGYQKLLKDGDLDRCGVTLLAGKGVGAPFVGAVAASLALSEVLRLLHSGPLYQVIELNLQGIEHRAAIPHPSDFSLLNPGYTAVSGQPPCAFT